MEKSLRCDKERSHISCCPHQSRWGPMLFFMELLWNHRHPNGKMTSNDSLIHWFWHYKMIRSWRKSNGGNSLMGDKDACRSMHLYRPLQWRRGPRHFSWSYSEMRNSTSKDSSILSFHYRMMEESNGWNSLAGNKDTSCKTIDMHLYHPLQSRWGPASWPNAISHGVPVDLVVSTLRYQLYDPDSQWLYLACFNNYDFNAQSTTFKMRL